MKTKLSRFILGVLSTSFVAGFCYGIYRNVNNISAYVPDDPKNDAIAVHIIIAISVIVIVTVIQTYRSRKHLPNVWKAPFTQKALRRFKATMIPRRFTITTIPRMILSFLTASIIVFAPFRIGEQIIGGLDKAATNNSWGGPSYAGSMAAHYMDMLILVYIAALILSWVMVRRNSNE